MKFVNAKIIGTGITPEQYLKQEVERGHPDYVLSRSDLVEIARCPARWRGGYQPGKETDATARGSLWDCLLLDAGAVDKRYAIIPQTYPAPAHHPKVKKGLIDEGDPLPWNANAGWCEQWLDAHQDKETVKVPEFEEASEAAAAVLATPELERIINASQKQMMVVGEWQDPVGGRKVPLRALLDIVPDHACPFGAFLLDYKTTVSAEMRAWTRTIDKFNYHAQAALHLDLYVAASGEARTTFGHIVQESSAPFHVEKRILSDEFLSLGRDICAAGLLTYSKCMDANEWPGYSAATVLNGWQVAEPEAYMVHSL
jgi:exodeoxyribonuclease VIII